MCRFMALFSAHPSEGEILLLVVAGFLAGIMKAVAGGGTFLTFPALVFTGLPSVAANQTSSIAVFPGQVASFWAYRNILAAKKTDGLNVRRGCGRGGSPSRSPGRALSAL